MLPYGSFASGVNAWMIFYETQALVIFHSKQEPHRRFNEKFIELAEAAHRDIFIAEQLLNGNLISTSQHNALVHQDFDKLSSQWVGDFRLAPYPGTTRYRFEGRVFRVY